MHLSTDPVSTDLPHDAASLRTCELLDDVAEVAQPDSVADVGDA